MNNKQGFFFGIVAITIVFGASISVVFRKQWVGLQYGLVPRIELGTTAPVMAAGSNWDGVRGVATFVRNVIRGIDGLLASLSSGGVLLGSSSTPITGTSGSFRWQFKGSGAATSNSNEVTGTSPTYAKSFEICSGSTRVFQMLFDDANSPSTGNGLVVVWQPKAFTSTLLSSALLKCSLGTSSGNKTMVCSWGNGPFDSSSGPNNARIRVHEDTTNGEIAFVGMARLQSGNKICTNAGWSGNDYYSLAFLSKSASPYNTLARFGVANTDGFSSSTAMQVCVPTSGTDQYVDHGYNSAQFNVQTNNSGTTYFVADSIGTTTDTTGYPTQARLTTLIAGTLNAGAFTPGNIDALAGTPPTFSGSGGPGSACGF